MAKKKWVNSNGFGKKKNVQEQGNKVAQKEQPPSFKRIECTVADVTCKAYPILENDTGISWKDSDRKSILKLCKHCGYDGNEFHNSVIVGVAFEKFADENIVHIKGKSTRVEDIYEEMVDWAMGIGETDDEDYSDEEVEAVARFLSLLDEVDDGRMIGYLVSALAREGYMVCIVPQAFFTTAVVINVAID